MEILAAITGKLAEFTVEPIGRQVGYLAHYKSNHQKLRTKLKELSAARGDVQLEEDQVTREGKKIGTIVLNWKTDVDAIITEAEEFLEDGRHEQTECLHGFCPHLVLRYQLSKKSTKLVEEIDELYGKKEFSNFAYDVPLQDPYLLSTGHYHAFDSRNSTVMKVMDELRNPSTEMILVWGIGGVGKTTLVEEVLRKAKDDNLFDDVVMVRDVKENPDLEKIQKEIATKLGMSINENQTLAERASSLCTRIKEKRTLVVLDDVWEKVNLVAVGLPRLVTCKVVLTSRSRKELSLDMRTQTYISLDILNEQEAWSLFEKMAGDVVKDSRIRSKAMKVAKKCGGLPVLIVTVARALKDRNGLHHWNVTLRRLGGFDDKELTEKAYLALEWSYDQLEDKELKPLFLLCGIIAVKNHIYLADLLKYGFGLDLIKNVDTIEDARDALYTLVDKLKDSCLLLDSDINMHVRMHDLVCEVATRIASRKHHVLSVGYGDELKEWPHEKDFFKRCSTMSLKSSNIPMLSQLSGECQKLEMFYLYNIGVALVEFPSNFFSEMEKLKVLGLTKVWMSLPPSLQLLKNLQTLCLEECWLAEVALVGHLSNLEILSFARSNIKQLPKEIGQLIRLRWLDLSDCAELKVISPGVISRLERLEDLSLRNVFLKWEAKRGGSNASLLELKDLSQLTTLDIYIEDANILPSNLFSSKLLRYQIYIGDVWKSRYSWEKTMAETALNTLKLKLAPNDELDHGIKTLLKRSEDLSLDGTEGVKSIAHQLHVEDFQQLIHLRLQNSVDLTYIINKKVVLPYLTTLSVSSCHHLRFLFSISMANSLVELKHLEVSSCAIMEAIVSTRDQSNGENIDTMFCKLESLTLDDLPNLARFFTENCIEFPPVKKFDAELRSSISDSTSSEKFDVESGTAVRTCLFDAQVKFPSLERLKINELGKLQTLWNNQLVDQDSFSRLKEVNVSQCNSVMNVFVPRMMGRLNALETLYISDCDSLEVVFEARGNDVEERPADTSSSPHQLRPFYGQSLGSVSISRCKSLKKIFPASVARGLQKLHSLDVAGCDEVEEIIGGEGGLETEPPHFVFPKVIRVQFYNLPKLSRFHPEIHASKWPLLKELSIYGRGKVVKIFAAELPIFPEKHEPHPLIGQSLFLVDKVRGLPPDFHTDRCLRRIGSSLGRFLQKDITEFGEGRIRIWVEMDLLQPVIFRRCFTVDDGIDVDLDFFFENLYGRCQDCGLLTHVGLPCAGPPLPAEVRSEQSPVRRNLDRVLSRVDVSPPVGPMVFGAQLSPQVGLERFLPIAKPKGRKEIKRKNVTDGGAGSSGVKKAPVPELVETGSDPASDGPRQEPIGSGSSVEKEMLEAAPSCGMRRKRVDEEGSSPKKLRLSLAVGRTNLDAMTMGLCPVKPMKEVYKKRPGRPKGAKNKARELKVVHASPMKKSPAKKVKTPRKEEKLVNGLPEFTVVEAVHGSDPSKGKEPIVV